MLLTERGVSFRQHAGDMTVRWRGVACVACLFATALGLSACVHQSGGATPALRLNELRGRYHGIGLGSSDRAVQAALGRGRPHDGTGAGNSPIGTQWGEIGAPTIVSPPSRSRRRQTSTRRYRDLSVLFDRHSAYAFIIVAKNVKTMRGIGIGSSLQAVRRRYPTVRCSEAVEGDSSFPYCAGRIARERYIWFGRDPVRSIAVGTTAFGD